MGRILHPGQFKLAELTSALERWEELVRSYERRKDHTGNRQNLAVEIKAGIIVEMCPEQLKTHLQLNAARFISYEEIKKEVVSFIEARESAGTGASPMDIGSLSKGGKGNCHKCGKPGHWAKDCRSGGGKSNKGDKGNKGTSKGDTKSGKGSFGKQHSHPKAGVRAGGKGKNDENLKKYPCPWCDKIGHLGKDCWWNPKNAKGGKKGLHSLEDGGKGGANDQQQPEEELGGLEICAISRDEIQSVEDWSKMKKVSVTFDTGAALSVLPVRYKDEKLVKQIIDEKTGTNYRAASHTAVQDQGKCEPVVYTEAGTKRIMKYRLADVRKPLAAGTAIMKAKNRIILDEEEGSYIVNKVTGDVIDLYEDKGVLKFDVWFVPPAESEASNVKPRSGETAGAQLAPLETIRESRAKDFGWQVSWP